MPSPSDDRITHLEAEVAQLKAQMAARPRLSLPRLSLAQRLTVAVLALMLALPAGVVLASHRFSDVPSSHQFHNAIAAVADAGVTAGCGGTRYCPNGLVTRGQMAAFLSRLGALAPGSAPKVNADRVDGRHANQLSRVTRWERSFSGAGFQVPEVGSIFSSFSIQAPAAGFITVNATVSASSGLPGEAAVARLWHRLPQGETQSPFVHTEWAEDDDVKHIPLTWVFPVPAGLQEFSVEVDPTVAPVISVHRIMATAIYTPYGWNGGSALTP